MEVFKQIIVQLPKPLSHKGNHQLLLNDIGFHWCTRKTNEKLPPLRKQKLSKKSQEKKDAVKINLQISNQIWNDWTFQIHWNKIECFNPKNCSERNNPYCVSFKGFYLRYNYKTLHWFGYSKLKPMGCKDFNKIKIILNKLEASLIETKIEQSDYGMKNNPDLYVVAELANNNADLT